MNNSKRFWTTAIFMLLLTVTSASAVLTDGQVAYYEMEETAGTIAQDQLDVNNGTYAGDLPTNITGIIGFGQDGDGSGDYITIDSLTDELSINNDFTISFWVKFDDVTTNTRVISSRVTSTDNIDIAIKDSCLRVNAYDGTFSFDEQAIAVNSSFHHVVFTYDTGTDTATGYFNNQTFSGGTSCAGGGGGADNQATILGSPDRTFNPNAAIDEIGFWNRTLTTDEISQLYNNGNGFQYPYTTDSPTVGAITITPSVPDSTDNITSNATVTTGLGGDYNLTTNLYLNGVLNKTTSHGQLTNGTSTLENFNCGTLTCNDGDNITFEYNASNPEGSDIKNATVEIQDQGFIEVQAYEKISGNQILNFNTTSPEIGGTTNGNLTLQTDVGTRTLTVNANDSGYLNSITNSSVEVVKQQTTEVNVTGFYDNNLSIRAKYKVDNTTINDFSGWIATTNTSTGFNQTFNTSSGLSTVGLIQGLNYTVFITSSNFTTGEETIVPNQSFVNQTFLLYKLNTLDLEFRDQHTNEFLNDTTVDFELISDVFSNNYTTTNGTLLLELLDPASYVSTYVAPGYTKRFYHFTVDNNTAQDLTLYLLNASRSDNITINIIDQETDEVEGALVKAQVKDVSTNTFKLVEIGKTDFEGETVLNLEKDADFYKLIIQFEGETLKITEPFIIRKNTYTFQVVTGEKAIQKYLDWDGISNSLNYDENNDEFTFTFNDKNGATQKVCLSVVKTGFQGDTDLGEQCVTTASGSINIGITEENASTYKADAFYFTPEDEKEVLNQLIIEIADSSPDTANSGLMFQVILTLFLVGAGFMADEASVPTLLALSFLIGKYLNFHDFSTAVLYAFMFVMIVVTGVAVKNRG